LRTSPLSEEVISLSRAARLLPPLRGDSPVSPCTVWRWANHGVRGPDGRVVKLRTFRVGGRTCTSVEALQEFLAALNSEPAPAPVAEPDQEQAEDELDRLGI
jgi:hypothetical protein